MVCFNAEIMVKEMLLTLVKHCWTQLLYYCTLNCCTKVFVKADSFSLFYNPSLKDDWYFLFPNAQFLVLIYLDQTLIDKHTDVPLQSCLELEAQQFCTFSEDLHFGFGETCKCWGNFGKMLGTTSGFNFRLPKPLIGRKLSGVKWSLQMYIPRFHSHSP